PRRPAGDRRPAPRPPGGDRPPAAARAGLRGLMSAQFVATLVKMALALGLLLNVVPVMVWVERRGSALIQDRPGPNRLGPLGLFQALADAVKFIFKEDVTPAAADVPMYLAAPVLALLPALTTFSVIPFGPDLQVGSHTIHLVVADADAGVLLFL